MVTFSLPGGYPAHRSRRFASGGGASSVARSAGIGAWSRLFRYLRSAMISDSPPLTLMTFVSHDDGRGGHSAEWARQIDLPFWSGGAQVACTRRRVGDFEHFDSPRAAMQGSQGRSVASSCPPRPQVPSPGGRQQLSLQHLPLYRTPAWSILSSLCLPGFLITTRF